MCMKGQWYPIRQDEYRFRVVRGEDEQLVTKNIMHNLYESREGGMFNVKYLRHLKSFFCGALEDYRQSPRSCSEGDSVMCVKYSRLCNTSMHIIGREKCPTSIMFTWFPQKHENLQFLNVNSICE